MVLRLQNVKGTRDYLPSEQIIRNKVRQVCEETFECYGCKSLETPILNMYDLMAYKYGGGAEILKEVYRLTDQGDRDLALRYDLTIPFAKVIGMNPTLKLPFKRYEIGKVFRNGPIKTGRYREFTQCDVDVVGIQSVSAEAELMSMAVEIFEKLGLEVTVQFNNRKLLVGLLEEFEVSQNQLEETILILDKVEKIGVNGIVKELTDIGIRVDTIATIKQLFMSNEPKTISYFQSNFSNPTLQEGIRELLELETYLQALDVINQSEFNPFLARGLSIYTGTIYEIFLKDGSITSSIGSGGRYNYIIGSFLEDGNEYPAVGISIGLDVVFNALLQKQQAPENLLDILIIPLGTLDTCLTLGKALRNNGYRVEIEQINRKLKRSLHYADKENIPFVLIIGENEIQNQVAVVKNMKTSSEQLVSIPNLITYNFSN
ncbi:histidine--tRNA ligase [Bacillus salitolerans]|uniref:Histidine--tRNA ligase n=1 Tax=Bacillus salitolerans TaxID=1437434 RepID=A0ABW4LKI9_9BACI